MTLENDEHPAVSRIWTDLDLEQEGMATGYFRIPYSTEGHGAAWIPMPAAIFRNGLGPRVLLMAGNHGDEYEGQVLLMKLMRKLDVSNVKGTIIILSAANAPAAYAGSRVSPLDGGNLNRKFPGNPNGSPTDVIAHFLEAVLLPQVDHVFDFHSGGNSDEFMPSAHIFRSADPKRFEQTRSFLDIFGMPMSLVLQGLMGNDQKLFGACERTGVTHMSTELGGAGRVSPYALKLAEEGLDRLLFELGALKSPITTIPARQLTQLHTRLPTRRYIYSYDDGLFEPYVQLGDQVRVGQIAGAIHNPKKPWEAPHEIFFEDSGLVFSIRSKAPTLLGDSLYMLAVPWEGQFEESTFV